MLVLSRKSGQSIQIGGSIELKILEIRDGRVRLGIECPRAISIVRRELIEAAAESTPRNRNLVSAFG
jgi:carbon storage regulator